VGVRRCWSCNLRESVSFSVVDRLREEVFDTDARNVAKRPIGRSVPGFMRTFSDLVGNYNRDSASDFRSRSSTLSCTRIALVAFARRVDSRSLAVRRPAGRRASRPRQSGPGEARGSPPHDGPETNPRDAGFNSNPASFLSAARWSDRAHAPRRAGGLTAGELSVPLGDPPPTRMFATIASASPSGARNAARSTPFEALVVHRLNPTATRPAYLR